MKINNVINHLWVRYSKELFRGLVVLTYYSLDMLDEYLNADPCFLAFLVSTNMNNLLEGISST